MISADKSPDIDHGVLEEARHQALVENTAQAIFYEIQEIEQDRLVNGQRWVWELLQNALDATPQDKQTRVRISWNEPELVFEHNGDAFTPDELAHLVYHGSTKYRHPTKRGKFGRGFLVTHLLSKSVHISGLERDPGGVFRFSAEIDRGGDADAIRQGMDFAWEQVKKSRRPVSAESEQSSSYNTRYVYRTDNVGRQAVSAGLESAKRCLPYVLAFIPELDEVSFVEPGLELKWRREETQLDPSDNSLRSTQVCLQKAPLLGAAALQPSEERFTIVEKLCSSSGGECTVSLMLREHQTPEVLIDDLVPRFFAGGLPVIGTEQLPLPMVIHSAEFQLEARRTGLHLEAAETPQQIRNWELVSLVPNGYIALLEYGSSKNWASTHLLANISECPSKSWLNSGKFTESVVRPVVQQILFSPDIRLVKTIDDERISVKDAVIPEDGPDGKLFDVLLTWKPVRDNLVERRVLGFWAEALATMARLVEVDVENLPAYWSLKRLALEVSACADLRDLSEKVDLKQYEGITHWLNTVIGLIIASVWKPLLMDIPLLPNQRGVLCKQSALYRDPGVDERLKDIAAAIGTDERLRLLHREISVPNEMLKD